MKWLQEDGLGPMIAERPDCRWMHVFFRQQIAMDLRSCAGCAADGQDGRLLCGTVDTWLLWNLTGGKTHATDHTNASRTMLYNLHTHAWDPDLLDLFGIRRKCCPRSSLPALPTA